MGRNAIERGSTRHLDDYPRRVGEVKAEIAKDTARRTRRRAMAAAVACSGADAVLELLHKPELRDPRGYIIPSDQPDFLTATKFVNALLKTGITVQRATRAFTVGRQAVSGRLVRREDGAGVPAARARHVRAAGSPERLPVSRAARRCRRTTTPAGRSRSRWA